MPSRMVSYEVGKPANMTVFDCDDFHDDLERGGQANLVATIVDGARGLQGASARHARHARPYRALGPQAKEPIAHRAWILSPRRSARAIDGCPPARLRTPAGCREDSPGHTGVSTYTPTHSPTSWQKATAGPTSSYVFPSDRPRGSLGYLWAVSCEMACASASIHAAPGEDGPCGQRQPSADNAAGP